MTHAEQPTLRLGIAFALLALALFLQAPQTATAQEEQPELDYSLELGGSVSDYDDDVTSNASSQFLAYIIARPAEWSWRFDLGHESRFDEDGIGFGALFTRFLSRGWNVSLGASSGTSDILHPAYRIGFGVGKDLVAGLGASANYTHIQSRDIIENDGLDGNSADMFGLGLTLYAGAHWIMACGYHYDIGHPGDTVSQSGDFWISYGSWRRWYLGAGARFGEVSYTLVGSGYQLLVDYDETAYFITASWYLKPYKGFNLKLEESETDFWTVRSATLSYFHEW